MTSTTTTSRLALVAALLAGTAQVQSANEPVAQPSSPAPQISVSQAPAAPAPVVVPTSNTASPAQNGVTQIVYTPQLPNAADLTNAASAQGFTVERIVQTSIQVIAFYRNASGQAITVAYQSLPPSGAPSTPVVTPPPQVVYQTAPRVVYYEEPYYPSYYPSYYPGAWYPPVSLSFGFGYRSFGHRHFHGGFRHR